MEKESRKGKKIILIGALVLVIILGVVFTFYPESLGRITSLITEDDPDEFFSCQKSLYETLMSMRSKIGPEDSVELVEVAILDTTKEVEEYVNTLELDGAFVVNNYKERISKKQRKIPIIVIQHLQNIKITVLNRIMVASCDGNELVWLNNLGN